MSEEMNLSENLPKRIAETISELPELPEDFVRLVHLTHELNKESLLRNGLNYSKYGMAMSMARAWGNPEMVEYYSDDQRFFSEGTKALVMDMPNSEWKLHNDITKCPGIIEPSRIVGFVDTYKLEQNKE